MIYINVSNYHINLGSLRRQIQKGKEFDTSLFGKEDIDKCTDLKRAIVAGMLVPKEPKKEVVEIKKEVVQVNAAVKKPKGITRVTTTDNKAVVVDTEKEVQAQPTDQEIATESGTMGAKTVKTDSGEKAVVMEQKAIMPDINQYGAKPIANVGMDKGTVVMTAPKDLEDFEKDLKPALQSTKTQKAMPDFDKMNFQDVKEIGKEYGLKVNGITKENLIKNIKAKIEA